MTKQQPYTDSIAVIGGGPAGLMAAEIIANAGYRVDLFDAMPSVGRKFLLAGVGGMNITHSEAKPDFITRYREAAPWIADWLENLDAERLQAWIHELGIDTFVGSSGRVFPTDMKAAPLLRAWLRRLREAGVQLHTRHRWLGWTTEGALRLQGPEGELNINPKACVLALGGGSWARLGSDGSWVAPLRAQGAAVRDLQPSNCGFICNWSAFLSERFAGQPLKPVVASVQDKDGQIISRRGECILTHDGMEGSLIYALSAPLREQLTTAGEARLMLDLAPDRNEVQLAAALAGSRKGQSLATLLRKKAGLDALKVALLHERFDKSQLSTAEQLARAIKQLPLSFHATRPLDQAISSAGGVQQQTLNADLMLKALPGVFCAGEMLDWEAPTGGYLLTACFASGKRAGEGVIRWLAPA
ncbi:TIGR03862 family flavoprotein [Halopseudomonas sabulinigri]|uniref:TIGR03862 family flavoprotein n=1 Tax=Halopseudomonas sabulinigri TaxID=472181 RepID=A0ABP9ZR34_9GAMM